MNTTEIVAKALAAKYERTHFEDEYAIIIEMSKILTNELGFSKTMTSFIINDEDFLGEALDEFYSLTC